jgi:hypothetical protein
MKSSFLVLIFRSPKLAVRFSFRFLVSSVVPMSRESALEFRMLNKVGSARIGVTLSLHHNVCCHPSSYQAHCVLSRWEW